VIEMMRQTFETFSPHRIAAGTALSQFGRPLPTPIARIRPRLATRIEVVVQPSHHENGNEEHCDVGGEHEQSSIEKTAEEGEATGKTASEHENFSHRETFEAFASLSAL
jgi:hypothetical protein